ncbi:hypothetical protein [Streptomyces iakyrus]
MAFLVTGMDTTIRSLAAAVHATSAWADPERFDITGTPPIT